ncbi:hypothetical protein C8A01DRAFT_35317 [Parachaetomium inaequale]|uniref:Zn(2)-C6 fungal-type domain-containing protein n=1 Tax=Parachaetomium inaequale TaxID=2588326 RepID=A0AAN6PID8_9PEZI|nr:hypothetical protein C8A01DRAFT_35317 [Parachaetomium inaequale]
MAPTKNPEGTPHNPIDLTTTAPGGGGVVTGRITKRKKPDPGAPGGSVPNTPKKGKASGPSCLPCRKAKARCDRVLACARCLRAKVECPGEGDDGKGVLLAGGAKLGKACERCKRMKAACVRKDVCVRCDRKGIECVMA